MKIKNKLKEKMHKIIASKLFKPLIIIIPTLLLIMAIIVSVVVLIDKSEKLYIYNASDFQKINKKPYKKFIIAKNIEINAPNSKEGFIIKINNLDFAGHTLKSKNTNLIFVNNNKINIGKENENNNSKIVLENANLKFQSSEVSLNVNIIYENKDKDSFIEADVLNINKEIYTNTNLHIKTKTKKVQNSSKFNSILKAKKDLNIEGGKIDILSEIISEEGNVIFKNDLSNINLIGNSYLPSKTLIKDNPTIIQSSSSSNILYISGENSGKEAKLIIKSGYVGIANKIPNLVSFYDAKINNIISSKLYNVKKLNSPRIINLKNDFNNRIFIDIPYIQNSDYFLIRLKDKPNIFKQTENKNAVTRVEITEIIKNEKGNIKIEVIALPSKLNKYATNNISSSTKEKNFFIESDPLLYVKNLNIKIATPKISLSDTKMQINSNKKIKIKIEEVLYADYYDIYLNYKKIKSIKKENLDKGFEIQDFIKNDVRINYIEVYAMSKENNIYKSNSNLNTVLVYGKFDINATNLSPFTLIKTDQSSGNKYLTWNAVSGAEYYEITYFNSKNEKIIYKTLGNFIEFNDIKNDSNISFKILKNGLYNESDTINIKYNS